MESFAIGLSGSFIMRHRHGGGNSRGRGAGACGCRQRRHWRATDLASITQVAWKTTAISGTKDRRGPRMAHALCRSGSIAVMRAMGANDELSQKFDGFCRFIGFKCVQGTRRLIHRIAKMMALPRFRFFNAGYSSDVEMASPTKPFGERTERVRRVS